MSDDVRTIRAKIVGILTGCDSGAGRLMASYDAARLAAVERAMDTGPTSSRVDAEAQRLKESHTWTLSEAGAAQCATDALRERVRAVLASPA